MGTPSSKSTLLWYQAGTCSGDTMSLLCAENPSFDEFLEQNDVELMWHPSLSNKPVTYLPKLMEDIEQDEQPLDILCIEGSIIIGPNGSGMYDTWRGTPKKDIILALCQKAKYVVAIGTCASYGGVHAAPPNPTDCCGLQYQKGIEGGLLSWDWRSKSGSPVINISGCPAHPKTMLHTLQALVQGNELALNEFNQPDMFYSTLVHQGCSRNEYHEYDIEEREFGQAGCLFYNLGCQGPMTKSTCNTELWNGMNSKTRAGVPCLGCVSPNFPRDAALFETEKLGDTPVDLPLGVSRPRYLAYKGLAKAASPARVKNREMKP